MVTGARRFFDVGDESCLDPLRDPVTAFQGEHCGIEPASDAAMLRHLPEG